MSLLSWFRDERAWAKVFGRQAYLSRRHVKEDIWRIGGCYGNLFYRKGDSDLDTFWQVFKNHEYDLSPFQQQRAVQAAYEAALKAGRTPLIIDAGANVGAASVWFATQFPSARVLAVEPDPKNAAICRLNASGRSIEVVEAAIGATAGSVSVLPTDASWGIRTMRGGEIPVVTMADLIGRIPNATLLLVKIDIEGFESDLFSAATDWISTATAIFVEPHDWMLPGERTSRSFRQAIGSEFDMLIAGENLLFVRCD